MTPITFEKALSKAAHMCVQSEKAPQDVYDKLISWGMAPQLAEKIICQLKEEKFINEDRFAHAFVHDKFEYEHWGKQKISYHLRGKGISESKIENAIDDVISDEDYVSSLVDLLKSKLRNVSLPLEQNDRARLYRFSMQRGFDSRTFSMALKIAGDSSDDSDFE